MRLSHIELEGFRGISRPISLDLDADTIILRGANGRGKTCVFDGILWALTGSVSRIADEPEDLISFYAEEEMARVRLALKDANDRSLEIVRTATPEDSRVQVREDDESYRQVQAEGRLVSILWPDGPGSKAESRDREQYVTHCCYLQQDLIRNFVEAGEDEQFQAISSLFGVQAMAALQQRLSTQKTSWTKATNRRDSERTGLKTEVMELEQRVAELREATDERSESAIQWKAWWKQVVEHDVDIQEVPPADTGDAAEALDSAIRTLRSKRRKLARRTSESEALLELIRDQPQKPDPELRKELEETLAEQKENLEELRDERDHIRAEIKVQRQRLAETQGEQEELALLADLALRHLNGACPVCTQPYDLEVTKNHLRELRSIADGSERKLEEFGADRISETTAEIENAKSDVAEVEEKLSRLRDVHEDWQKWQEERSQRLDDLGLELNDDTEIEDAVAELPDTLNAKTDRLKETIDLGEDLALYHAGSAQSERLAELEEQLAAQQKELQDLVRWQQQRHQSGELAQRIISELRDAAVGVVNDELDSAAQVFQKVYQYLHPHPSFTTVDLKAWMSYGRGRASPEIRDPTEQIHVDKLKVVLSNAQLNALAIALFVTFNLTAEYLPIDSILLDDPVQALDDINALGAIDLFRRIQTKRQLVLSTHDNRLGDLLVRKLRPVEEGDVTRIFNFTSWDRDGPTIVGHDRHPEEKGIEIVA